MSRAATVPAERTDRLHPIRITSVVAEHPGTGDRPYVTTGEPLAVTLHFSSLEPTDSASFVVEFRNETGTVMLRTVTGDLGQRLEVPAGSGAVTFRYESFPFLDGAYDVAVGVEHRGGGAAVRLEGGRRQGRGDEPHQDGRPGERPGQRLADRVGPAGLAVPVASLPTMAVRARDDDCRARRAGRPRRNRATRQATSTWPR